MEQLLQKFSTNEALDLVGPFVDTQPFTKKITTRNSMFLLFALVPYVTGQDLTPKAAVRVLVPVMTALGLKLP